MAARGRKRRKCPEPGCTYKDESPTGTGLARHLSRTHGIKAESNGVAFVKPPRKRTAARKPVALIEKLEVVFPDGIRFVDEEQLDFDLALIDRLRET